MSTKARILIIDDDADYRASTRALLEGEGYEVLEGPSGREGLAALRAHKPDLVVLDIMMESPVEGYSVIQALKLHEEYKDVASIPVIMVSSVQQDPATLFPMSDGAEVITPDAYFTKPLDIPTFLECARRTLDR
jgi:CheY-like chemotaxis protein